MGRTNAELILHWNRNQGDVVRCFIDLTEEIGGRGATTFTTQLIDLTTINSHNFADGPAKWWLPMDVLGRSMTNTHISSDNRDDVAI